MPDEDEKKPVGRPSTYTNKLRDAICDRLADGETLRSICRDEDMPSRPTIARWAMENIGEEFIGGEAQQIGFYYHYTRARDLGLDNMADEIIEIGDDGTNDYMTKELDNGKEIEVVNHENIARSRLRSDNRKWYVAKLAPKRYGSDKTIRHQQLDADGEATDPAKTEINISTSEIMDAVHAQMEKVSKDDDGRD